MGFTNPAALLLSALLAVLFFLYLWERQRRRLDVPALLLWERVPDAVVRRSRFQPDLLFFLQLAILSALILGLADPFLRDRASSDTHERQIVVLDTSASMQAHEAKGTRLALAKRAIADRLAALSPHAELMLVTVANRPNVEVPFTTDRGRFAAALERVEAVDVGTNLDGALTLATRAADVGPLPTRIDLFTDIPAAQLAPAWRDRVNVWPIGATDDNLAIENLRVFQGTFQSPQEARAHVTVRNHSGREAHGSLRVLVDDVEVDRQLFSIAPHAAREFVTTGFPRGGLLRARLEQGDALAVDDTALAWVRATRHLRVLVVSAASPLVDDLGSIATGGGFLDLATQTPEEYTAAPEAAEVVLFHRFVPSALPDSPSLFIFPEASDGFLAAQREAKEVDILEWDREHPALRGLQLRNAFPLARAKVLALPPWADALVQGRAADGVFPLAYAGEQDGRRIAVLAFDLAAERLLRTDHEGLLLLFLNLVDWLTAESNPVRLIRTGEAAATRDFGDGAEIVGPRGRVIALGSGEHASFTPFHEGAYTVRGAHGESVLLANFADPRESDIGRTASAATQAVHPRERHAGTAATGRGIGWFLLLAAAALLTVEWPLARREA